MRGIGLTPLVKERRAKANVVTANIQKFQAIFVRIHNISNYANLAYRWLARHLDLLSTEIFARAVVNFTTLTCFTDIWNHLMEEKNERLKNQKGCDKLKHNGPPTVSSGVALVLRYIRTHEFFCSTTEFLCISPLSVMSCYWCATQVLKFWGGRMWVGHIVTGWKLMRC